MKIVITGAAGYIGTALCSFLRKKGHEVIPLDSRENEHVEDLIIGNVYDLNFMNMLFEEHEPTALIHLAAMSNVRLCQDEVADCFDENLVGPLRLAKFCVVHGIKFIFTSTCVFDDTTLNNYIICKAQVEQNLPKEAIVLKLANVVGAYPGWKSKDVDNLSITDAIIHSARGGLDLILRGNVTRRFVYIEEVLEKFAKIIDDILGDVVSAFLKHGVAYRCEGESCMVDMETWISLFSNYLNKPISYTRYPELPFEVSQSDPWISYNPDYVKRIIDSYEKWAI